MAGEKPVAGNGVTYKDVYELIEQATERVNAKIEEQFSKLREEAMAEIRTVKTEIYGEKNVKGLREKVGDLERNTRVAHGLQATLTLIGTAIATSIGLKQ